jgi:hypothetical protein
MQMTEQLVDELAVQLAALDLLLHRNREPLWGADPPKLAGVYLLFGLHVPPYRHPLVQVGCFPLYAGSAVQLQERLRRHRRNALGVPSLDSGRRLHVVWLELNGPGSALLVERLLIDLLKPLWNEPFLRGFGSRWQGRTRENQAPPPWAVLHPGRRVGTGPSPVSSGLLALQAAHHLESTACPLWGPLDV